MRTLITAAAALAALPAQAAFLVTYEAPGVQHSTATFANHGVEDFDGRQAGEGQSFTTDFGTSGVFSGVYTGVQLNSADRYGGAGGSGNYAVEWGGGSYTLELSTTRPGGVTYFGYWLSALDGNNQVSFIKGGREVFSYTPTAMAAALGRNRAYYDNPNPAFAGQNAGELYAFVNFFSTESFDAVRFEQLRGGGYESDNHTVGYFTATSGTAVPEPASWAMLIAGFGLTGAAARRRVVSAVAA